MLATAVHPLAGLGATLVAGVSGTLFFAAQRGTEPPPHALHPEEGKRVRPPIPWAAIGPLTGVAAALGVLFGAAEVVTVAFSEEQGHKSAAGFLLAVWALGSLLAGLVSGAISWKRGPLVRLRWGALGMALAMLPLAFVPSIPVMGVVLLVGGLAISPTLIAAMSLAEQVLPPARLTEGMAFIQTGLAAGLAPGAAVAGVLIDEHGASPAYWVCAAGGLVVLAAALLTRVPTTVPVHERSEQHVA
jgi:MFS family permease